MAGDQQWSDGVHRERTGERLGTHVGQALLGLHAARRVVQDTGAVHDQVQARRNAGGGSGRRDDRGFVGRVEREHGQPARVSSGQVCKAGRILRRSTGRDDVSDARLREALSRKFQAYAPAGALDERATARNDGVEHERNPRDEPALRTGRTP